MPTSPATDHATLLRFAGEDGLLVEGRWLLVDDSGAVSVHSGLDGLADLPAGVRTAVAVPGTQVMIHWLELAEGLTQAQAAAASRLMLADAIAGGLDDTHVAVGTAENGLTPVAVASYDLMDDWTISDPDLILPTPFLLMPPAEGLLRRDDGTVSDYRGTAVAFSVEPDLAELLIGDAPVRDLDEGAYEAGLVAVLAKPVINLRQGLYSRRRQWQWIVDPSATRRIGWLVLVLAALSLVVLLVQIMRYSSAASVLEDEAARIGARAPAGDAGPGFTPLASVLFAAVQAVPNVELGRLDYRPDGALAATVAADTPATLQALRRQLETGGLQVQEGSAQPMGARPTAELLLRPS